MYLRLYTILATYVAVKDEGTNDLLQASPVKLTVFYERLCPDCINFFENQLQPVYEQLGNIIDLDIYGYGNIKEHDDSSYHFQCQHGLPECYGNKVLECGKKYIEDHEKYLKFAFCVMASDKDGNYGKICSDKLGIDFTPIESCANSTEGDVALHDAGVAQKKMAPTLSEVPWILVNGKFNRKANDEAQEDLLELVCKTYKGKKPKACP